MSKRQHFAAASFWEPDGERVRLDRGQIRDRDDYTVVYVPVHHAKNKDLDIKTGTSPQRTIAGWNVFVSIEHDGGLAHVYEGRVKSVKRRHNMAGNEWIIKCTPGGVALPDDG